MKKQISASNYARGRISEFWQALKSGHLGKAIGLAGRYILLIPMAYAIVVILLSDDVMLRLAGVISLIIMEQVRDWWMVRDIIGKGNS